MPARSMADHLERPRSRARQPPRDPWIHTAECPPWPSSRALFRRTILVEHVAEQRALLDRVVESHMRVRELVKLALRHPLRCAFPVARLRRDPALRLPDSDRNHACFLLERNGERRPDPAELPRAGQNECRSYI